jgi:uncharacterized protein DUF3302
MLGFELDIWDYLTFAVMIALIGAFLAVAVFVLGLPGRITIARKHPDADAINIMGWLGFMAVVPWMQAFMWAFRETAVLAGFAVQGASGASGERNRNRGPFRLAHVPAHVCDAPQGERRRREGCARANATRKHLGHTEHLRASDHANQARCAEPGCELVARQK